LAVFGAWVHPRHQGSHLGRTEPTKSPAPAAVRQHITDDIRNIIREGRASLPLPSQAIQLKR
jgi:hypothetical protein